MMRETIDTTYADLRPTDLVIDKSGQAWPLDKISSSEDGTTIFWLCDPVSKVMLHLISKQSVDPVKVSRLPTQADEAAKLEAEFPVIDHYFEAFDGSSGMVCTRLVTDAQGFGTDCGRPASEHALKVAEDEHAAKEATMAEAVAAVEEIGGTVEAEVTADEVDAAAAATDDAPVSLPPFADMTPLEQRSHLYLLHGLYGSDVTGRAELIAIHDQAHAQHAAGTLNSRHVPHVHTNDGVA